MKAFSFVFGLMSTYSHRLYCTLSLLMTCALFTETWSTDGPRTALGVHLVGGESVEEGRVEIYRYGYGWGTICDDRWDDADADVVCGMLGYDYGTAYGNARFGQGVADIFMDNVRCEGDEVSLWDCARRDWGQHDCSHSEDAGVRCAFSNGHVGDFHVRIGSSGNRLEGRVQIYFDGEWGSLCNDGWTDNESRVVCRALSLEDGEAVPGVDYPEITGRVYEGYLGCHGNESSLGDCPRQIRPHMACGHEDDAAVRCNGDNTIRGIRLGGGNNNEEGRVEIFVREEWGTICDDSWDDEDATVACRMLGFRHGIARSGTFGEGTGEIWLDDVACSGDETSLEHCEHRDWGNDNCSHSEDAGVRCSEGP